VAPEEPIEPMMLVLTADPAIQAELDQLTAAQQDPASPKYHQWITPEEYGHRFGVAEGDSNRITEWLAAEGFQVEEIPAGRRLVIFGGSAA
jgi:subtilase family serine protease